MPDVLYKYLPSVRVDVLRTGRIRFSPVEDLNDPFESLPRVRVNRESAERSVHASGFRGEKALEAVKSFAAYAESTGPTTLWKMVNDEFGILSLTADPLHPVMWGQYAEGYRGYVLGLDAKHRWLAPVPTGHDMVSRPQPVTYQAERPSVELGATSEQVDLEAFHKGLFLTKHEAWAFEQEFRVGRDVRGAIRPAQAEGVTNLFPLPPEIVVEVLMGPRMNPQVAAELEAMLRSGRFPKARLKRVVLDTDNYLLCTEVLPLK